MTGITVPRGYPYPEGTDPVADGAQAIQDLAESVNDSIDAGVVTGATTDANGDLVIAHNLGVLPSAIICTGLRAGNPDSFAAYNRTTTNFTVRIRNPVDGSVRASASNMAVYWLVIR